MNREDLELLLKRYISGLMVSAVLGYIDGQRDEIERLKDELDKLKQLNHPICLICGATEPCNLKNDPHPPCTFDLTPKEIHTWCMRLQAKLATAKGEVWSQIVQQIDYRHCTVTMDQTTLKEWCMDQYKKCQQKEQV